MQSIPKNPLLSWEPNALNDIRKIHNLDAPGRLEEALNILKEWVEKQDHFLYKDFSLDYLERSLIFNKGSVEKTKRQIDKLCTFKTLLPHFFKCHNILNLKDVLSQGSIIMLPRMTADFYRIFLVKFNGKMLTDISVIEYCHYAISLCEYNKVNDYTNGFILMYDFREINLTNLISKLNPVLMQEFTSVITEGYGARLKAIHLLTPSTTVDLLVKILKQFLSQKISQRIFVHKTLEELHKVVPRDLLPEDHNGKEKSVDELSKDWKEELSSKKHVEYMKMMNKARTDEKRRRSDKFNDEYMGKPGAFRNLSVD